MAEDSTALTDVVDELKDASQGKDTVEVGQLIDALKRFEENLNRWGFPNWSDCDSSCLGG